MTEARDPQTSRHVLVLGAGVVGCATALTLARRGYRVTLLDRDGPGSGASHGNAGAVAPLAGPQAMPGLPLKVPGMLLNPTGPLTIRPTQFVKALPWFLRFILESMPIRAEANSIALYALTGRAAPAWKELARGTPGESLLRDVGWLKVFSTDAGFQGFAKDIAFMARRGAPHDILTEDDIRQMEPNLAPIFKHGVFQPDGLCVRNPRRLVEGLAEAARALGAEFLQEDARSLTLDTDGMPVLTTDKGEHRPDRIVLSAGAFSKKFAKTLGANPLLEAERGYHAMFDTPDKSLSRSVYWVENSLVVSPMETGVRMTTQAEFGGLDAPPSYARLERMIPNAKALLPSLNITVRETWMGRRPSTPDSVPYLCQSPDSDRVFFNFGHQHLGLTMAAISARVLADMMDGRPTEVDETVQAYRALR